jgi:hypothetical protein
MYISGNLVRIIYDNCCLFYSVFVMITVVKYLITSHILSVFNIKLSVKLTHDYVKFEVSWNFFQVKYKKIC